VCVGHIVGVGLDGFYAVYAPNLSSELCDWMALSLLQSGFWGDFNIYYNNVIICIMNKLIYYSFIVLNN